MLYVICDDPTCGAVLSARTLRGNIPACGACGGSTHVESGDQATHVATQAVVTDDGGTVVSQHQQIISDRGHVAVAITGNVNGGIYAELPAGETIQGSVTIGKGGAVVGVVAGVNKGTIKYP